MPSYRVLAERRNRTQGAMEKARADIAAAEAGTANTSSDGAKPVRESSRQKLAAGTPLRLATRP